MGSLAQETSSCKNLLPCDSYPCGRLAACARRPVQMRRRLKVQVKGTSTSWRLSTPPGDDASEDLISQVSLAVTIGAAPPCRFVQAPTSSRSCHVLSAKRSYCPGGPDEITRAELGAKTRAFGRPTSAAATCRTERQSKALFPWGQDGC